MSQIMTVCAMCGQSHFCEALLHSPKHCGSWEPPGRLLDYCKFLFSSIQSLYAGIDSTIKKDFIQRFWKKIPKLPILNYILHIEACLYYFLKAYLNSWCHFLPFDRSHCIFWWRNEIFLFFSLLILNRRNKKISFFWKYKLPPIK